MASLENLNNDIKRTSRSAMSTLDDILRRISQEYMNQKLKKLREKKPNGRTERELSALMQQSAGEHGSGQQLQGMFESGQFLHDFGKIDGLERDFASISASQQGGQFAEAEFDNAHQPI